MGVAGEVCQMIDNTEKTGDVEIEEIVMASRLEALRPEWAGLFAASGQTTPFLSPDWLLPWERCLLSTGLWVLAIRRSGVLAALAPFYLYVGPTAERQITLLGNGVSDRLDLLAHPA